LKNLATILLSAVLLAACASGPKGVRVVNGGTSAIPEQEGQTIRNLGGSDIAAAITGKTFQYTRNDGNGFITYNADGTFNYQDDAKGDGVGRWSASGDQYCETFQGGTRECGVFRSTGDAYFAANSRLVEMKI
jgi:hypothetical protein